MGVTPDILNDRNNTVKLWQIIYSGVTTSGVLIVTFGDSKPVGIMAAIVSLLTLGLSTYVKKYDLGKLAQKHASTAILIWDIREKYFSLLTDIKAGLVNEDAIRETRDHLQTDLYEFYKGSPRTISKAYVAATNEPVY